MKLTLSKEALANTGPEGGLEIAVQGFAGDASKEPVQVFIEFYNGQLAVHVWDGTSEDANTHIIMPVITGQGKVTEVGEGRKGTTGTPDLLDTIEGNTAGVAQAEPTKRDEPTGN